MFPLSIPSVLVVILLTVLYLWADRFSGGGFGWVKLSHDGGGPLRGHGTLYAGIVVTIAGALLAGMWGAIFGGCWAITRSVAWRLRGHSAVTPSASEISYAFIRHSFPILLIGVVGVLSYLSGNLPFPPIFAIMVLYPVVATTLARAEAKAVIKGKDINPQVEMARGATFGLLAGIALTNL